MKILSYVISSSSIISPLFSTTSSTISLFFLISGLGAVEEASTLKRLARLDDDDDDDDDAFNFNAFGTIFILFGSLRLEILLYKARDLRDGGGSWLCTSE